MFHLFHAIEGVKRKRETGLISQSWLASLTKKPWTRDPIANSWRICLCGNFNYWYNTPRI